MSIGGAASAQTAASIPAAPHVFLERAYFAPLNPVGRDVSTLLFEGEAAAHYFIFNTMDWDWTHTGGWRYAWPVSFIPTVRMSTSKSSPVLTPSYRIRPFWFQAVYLSPESDSVGPFTMYGVSAGAMHYSNGQDGCTYLGFARATTTADSACVVTDAELAARRIPNTRDGDFSTTFFPIAFNWRRGRISESTLHIAHQQTVGLEFQIHPLGMQPGGIDRALAMEYGRHQINASYEYEWLAGGSPGMRRVAVKGVVRTPQNAGRTWTMGAVEFSRTYDKRQGLGWFLRATFGGDYYNIHFKERSNPLVTVGAIWDPGTISYLNHIGRPGSKP
jgi:hypothetical protein